MVSYRPQRHLNVDPTSASFRRLKSASMPLDDFASHGESRPVNDDVGKGVVAGSRLA
jgi:hypothetical protein